MLQMCWLSSFGTNEQRILHLRTAPNQPWKPYTAFPQYAVSDYRIPGGSLGWATYQKLRLAGWVLVSSINETGQISDDYQDLAS